MKKLAVVALMAISLSACASMFPVRTDGHLRSDGSLGMVDTRALTVGMDAATVRHLEGLPNRVNRTVTAGHTREQWVYSGKGMVQADRAYWVFLYFDNGHLIGWQD